MSMPSGRTEHSGILQEIARVLDVEIEALQQIRAGLTPEFSRAVELIHNCAGHLFVTGVGKSGIIGQKIAATLRSTGTPATFFQASEALHGDVGIIRSEDLILAIGKAGETTELNSLLKLLKAQGTTVLSITSNGSSTMASLSDLVLDLKIVKEACPLNLAPTASTTGALAVGDAIAVALMKLKNVTADDFARHHPGGQLGRRLLLTVGDVMRKDAQNPVISVGSSIKEMLVRMTEFHVGAISVIDDSARFLGLVTDYDVRKALESEDDIRKIRISEIMNPSPLTISADDKAIEALELMRRRSKPTAVLPVVDNYGKVIGMVHLHDLVSAGL
jgi:arabinose-5-phosphate isomerase